MADTPEQQARDMLDRMGVEDAQSYTSGDVVELANLIAARQHADREAVRTGAGGATSAPGMAASEVLFAVTVYRLGGIRIVGHGRREALPDILRLIAASIEAGATVLGE